MDETILVNFHCHSNFSDGELPPEVVAANLVSAGVRYAALTDHDTLEGLPRFEEVLKKRGSAFLSGVELTTRFNAKEVHLLAYGFDPQHAELAATLLSLRQAKALEVHSIADSIRKAGNSRHAAQAEGPAPNAAPGGWLEISEAIALVHRAGGRAFLAHPLMFAADFDQLEAQIAALKELGLDGIEVYYAPYSVEMQSRLRALAARYDLLVCAGTDFHDGDGKGGHTYGIEMPREDWISFREAVLAGPPVETRAPEAEHHAPAIPSSPVHPAGRAHHFRKRYFVLRIFLPTFIAIALFLSAFWAFILPAFEQTLLGRKREMIRELTNSAWSILASYQRDEQSGLLTREQAQSMAAARIESLRYGEDGKDYFWIQDMQPRMIMHPYRPDLNGQDLTDFTDPRGARIFVEFATLVQRQDEGYIDYVWQWKDDPQRLEPKESFVKGFAPWGWVIGTGIYIDDVHQEIARLEQNLINVSVVVSAAVVLLLLFVLQQSLRIERQRQEVLDSLHESTERYHALVEAASEGTLLVLEERCRYANPTFLNMLGCTPRQLEFLELADLLPAGEGNAAVWQRIRGLGAEQPPAADALEGYVRRMDGGLVECVLALHPIQYAGQQGFILLARDVTRHPDSPGGEGLAAAAAGAPLGIFHARAARRAVFLDINAAGRALLPRPSGESGSQPSLADFFADPAEFDQFMARLLTEGEVRDHLLHLETPDASVRFISLSARLVRDEQDQPVYMAGLLEDVTDARRQETGREALVERLQASLLFLHEPVASLGFDAVVCAMEASIEQVSQLMTARSATAVLVATADGTVVGIVTDHDLRARVLAENLDLSAPIYSVMSAPLIKIHDQALVYEALMRMEEKGVRHLAVEDQNGEIVRVIDSKSLIQFQRYGPLVLSREISRAGTPGVVAQCCQRVTPLARTLMDSSTRTSILTGMLTSICDAATARLIELGVQDLGPPPAPFAFIAMGSQGRQEQTLLTDQDNGIIFAAPDDGSRAEAAAYFLRLGARVCDGLNQAGYAHCRGNVMASNPRWCRSLPEWLAGFDQWVERSEPQEIIDLSIFFDFRTVYGDSELLHGLRRHITSILPGQPAFLQHFARNALSFKPPFRLVGNIYLGSGGGEHAGEINLKDAMMPMVSFARLYALRHQVNETHTLKRIEALAERNLILASSRDETTAAYDFLMQLRLQSQLAALQAGRPAVNTIQLAKMGYSQREMLKQAFSQIAAVQKKISYDFPGGV